MISSDFAAFYRAVHDKDPFPWQMRLANHVLEKGWPKAISVPTGCGKTSVLDIAVFALAAQAGRADRTAPMRIFFVVDRRLVVDDVAEHAKKIVEALEKFEDPAVMLVAERLKRFQGGKPLDFAVMRGGMYRSDTWADAPNQPVICASTVDQVGSRLLFRGYGISPSRQPIHAGLIGNDSLLIVDEAHLSQPFLQTLDAVRRYQSEAWREAPARGLQFVQMSATVEGGFKLEAEDFASEALRPRLEAHKIAELKEAADLPREAAAEAERIAKRGACLVAVVVNTVAAARTIFEKLQTQRESILLTGRIRPYDRDELLRDYKDRIRTGRARTGDPLFVVATQTVEVGADLDFDALVTEAAPLDSLRQRFGRLNRLGSQNECDAVVLKQKRAGTDVVYGEATDTTWDWLKERSPGVDFGILHLSDAPENCNSARRSAPLMFPVHVETWAQTNPRPAVDPDVAPFLHGKETEYKADVQLVWRADLPEEVGKWQEILAEAPAVSTEALPVPFRAALRWLSRQAADVADIEGVSTGEEGPRSGMRDFLIWEGPNKKLRFGIRPGDTVVVRSTEGGCDRFGWNPDSQAPVRDIGDLCANVRAANGGGKARLRIHPLILFPGAEQSEARKELSVLLNQVSIDEDVLPELWEFIEQRVKLPKELDRRTLREYGGGNALVVGGKRVRLRRTAEADDSDENDDASLDREPRSLREHTRGVLEKTELFLQGCGVNGSVGATLRHAAELHDLGKCDVRFQLMLGNTKSEPMAKSRRRRGRKGEYPEGARHEFGSVRLAEARGWWPEDCDPELALYLIGTHHGYGRPFPPVWDGTGPEISAEVSGKRVSVRDVHHIAHVGSGWADRYDRMNRKYGWWGLAYFEAILRRADCVQSREEEAHL
jgi:CRISPR-associated endonuclease/helicase Cas3